MYLAAPPLPKFIHLLAWNVLSFAKLPTHYLPHCVNSFDPRFLLSFICVLLFVFLVFRTSLYLQIISFLYSCLRFVSFCNYWQVFVTRYSWYYIYIYIYIIIFLMANCICGVMASILASSVVDHRFDPWSGWYFLLIR